MQLSEDYSEGLSIQALLEDKITIANKDYTKTILLTNTQIHNWPIDINNIQEKDFDLIQEHQPEVFIFGTGKRRMNLTGQWLSELMDKGIGVELMDTDAACRTFNILTAENRKVMAGLLIS